MEFIIICVSAFILSVLTLFSGFGLSTILMPVFAIFFPVQIAIGFTAIVHLVNGLFKFALLLKNVNRNILIKFGIPAILSAIVGASLLINILKVKFTVNYILFGHSFNIKPVNFVVGLIIIGFVLFELIPKFKNISFSDSFLPVGGVLSGFFGGLSGNQGAFRSIFLVKSNLSSAEFIATNAVIGILVDITRLLIYKIQLPLSLFKSNIYLIIAVSFFAVLGSFIATRFIKKIRIQTIRTIVAIMLLTIGFALLTGVI